MIPKEEQGKPAAHTHAWETAEVIFGSALVLGLILGVLFPLPLSALLPRVASIAIGVILLLTGFAIIGMVRGQFREAAQPTDPGHPTTQLITTGLFSWSRNPLYLGGVAAYLGTGALLNSIWLFILLVPTLIAVDLILIFPEERYLDAKFGEPYRQYVRSAHRWIGRRR